MTPILWGKPGRNILKLIFYINVNIVDAKCGVQHSRDIKQIISAAISQIYFNISSTQRSHYLYSPRGHNKEVHEVPGISHVASLVKHEAQSEDFGAHLCGEHHHEDDLQLFLK